MHKFIFLPSATKLRRLCFYRCLSVHGGGGGIPACFAGGIPACLAAGLRGGSGWYLSMPCRFPSPHPRGKFRGIWPGGSPGPHPRGKLRGIWLAGVPPPRGCLLPGATCSQEGACSWVGACSWGVCLLRGGGLPAPGGGGWWRHTPASRRLLLRTVRILLQCILFRVMVVVNAQILGSCHQGCVRNPAAVFLCMESSSLLWPSVVPQVK